MDFISKEDAVALITAEMDKIRTHSLVDGTARINLRLAKNIIEDMPSIDIVKCKECKKCYKDTDALTKQTVLICQKHKYEFDWEKVEADDFCSYGERRADDE